MKENIAKILKKIYVQDADYNKKLDSWEYKIPKTLTDSELESLKVLDLLPNQFETFEHDIALQRLMNLKNHKKLSLPFVTALFLKGITGENVRGRQTLMSFIYLKHLPEHKFQGNESCEICGLPKKETLDKTEELYSYYSGHSWNELPLHFLIELEEALKFDQPETTESDHQKLVELLSFIAEAEKDETPGQLEKRIAKHKVLPNTDKYQRYGILQTLAACGILPNDYFEPAYDKFSTQKELWEISKKMKGSSRSDVILPLAGWRGINKVNLKKYKEIFVDLMES
ncbi:hypothetical protein [Pedobacter sp. FW305-3-2-15-E-R2A2]|uniref:hypothetical protein n=1 Tax=Pedobacter sp. FW305-3-2-15-E-R2A2 TaxID=3140251 RepID=UPI00313FF1E8